MARFCVRFFNMSRMVKKQLQILDGIKLSSLDNGVVVSNSLGSIVVDTNGFVEIGIENGLSFKSLKDESNGMLGTSYVLVKNAMEDLVKGCVANLKMVGVGFKANVSGNFLRLYIGLSHDVVVAIPKGITVSVDADINIKISGNNRATVMQFARMVRDLKKPEPYKGKGIFLNDEKIIRKEGKKK